MREQRAKAVEAQQQSAERYAERDAAYRAALGVPPTGPLPRSLGNVETHARLLPVTAVA